MKFNKAQRLALDTSINKDVLISAGAGSGKTSTLTEKVASLINSKEIEPSELLVLTFTNNAAHNMQTKIVDKFDKELALKMMSAHIQTFDSFAQDLVKEFSSTLNLSNNIMIANEDVINAKKRSLLDNIFNEYLLDVNKKESFINLVKKYNLKNLDITKEVILDVYDKLEKMIPSKKALFIKQAKDTLFSKEYFDSLIETLINHYKTLINKALMTSYFIYTNYKDIESNNYDNLSNYFLDYSHFKSNHILTSSSNEHVSNLLDYILKLKDANGYEFINLYHSYLNDDKYNKAIKKTTKSFKEDERKHADIYAVLKSLLVNDLSILKTISTCEVEYNKLLTSKDDIKLILDIVKTLEDKLMDYKLTTNCFTFDDIAKFALNLFSKDEYKDIAETIRNRYKFIMIDEYQDNNDLQEEVINSLLKKKIDGTRAHLFAVGDAKQSIYAFRNSKVELFRNRAKEYTKPDDNHLLIPMNINYRSVKPLIDDINYIFSSYMSLEHGDINYKDPNERLIYEGEDVINVNNQTPFNIVRILNKNIGKIDPEEFEIEAIIDDIKDKIANRVQVYDSKDKCFRDCKYSDFLILMSKKKAFQDYQTAFLKHGIELNNKVSTNLFEVDAIVLLQSLINLISYIINGYSSIDLPHIYASIARSYIYQLSYQEIFDVLSNKNINIKDTHIYKKAEVFINNNAGLPFNEIFTNLLNEFNVISKLYLIGNINDNISKIESLYSILLSEESAGEGIYEFAKLFKDISKYKLDLSGESSVNVMDAVDMMSIHASKGLENKIIYLPYSFNKLGGDNNFDKKDYIFDKDIGILLPYYDYDPDNESNNLSKFTIPSLVNKIKEDKGKIDEFVRVLYVALTRAENTIYIVGNPKEDEDKEIKKETLYGMLYYSPHYIKIDEDYISPLIKDNVISEALYKTYLSLVNKLINVNKNYSINNFDNVDIYKTYKDLLKTYYIDAINASINNVLKSIIESLIGYYQSKYNLEINDIDKLKKDELLGLYLTKFENKSINEIFSLSFATYDYIDMHKYVDASNFATTNSNDKENISLLDEDNVNDEEIIFKERTYKKASITVKDEDLPDEMILERGTYLHSLMELVDLNSKDTSFINNKKDRELIDKVLTNPIFDKLKDAKVYKEYGYYDQVSCAKGFIDLFFIKDNHYYIIDYKSKHTENDGYKEQLHAYQRNIMNIFNVKKENIHLYLLSLIDNKLIPVDIE